MEVEAYTSCQNTWILSEKEREKKEILKTVASCIAALSSPK